MSVDEKIAKWLGVDCRPVIDGKPCTCPNCQDKVVGYPPYSSNMQYTMQVLDKLNKDDAFIKICNFSDYWTVAITDVDTVVLENKCLPLTICQAVIQLYNL